MLCTPTPSLPPRSRAEGASVNATDPHGWSALHYSSSIGNLEAAAAEQNGAWVQLTCEPRAPDSIARSRGGPRVHALLITAYTTLGYVIVERVLKKCA